MKKRIFILQVIIITFLSANSEKEKIKFFDKKRLIKKLLSNYSETIRTEITKRHALADAVFREFSIVYVVSFLIKYKFQLLTSI
jgi:hypothetical protein